MVGLLYIYQLSLCCFSSVPLSPRIVGRPYLAIKQLFKKQIMASNDKSYLNIDRPSPNVLGIHVLVSKRLMCP